MSPLLTSPITTKSFSFAYFTVLSNATNPGIPNCSYIAICGFTAGIKSYVASIIPLLYCQSASDTPSSVSPNSAYALSVMCFGM